MKKVKIILSAIIVLISTFFCERAIVLSRENQANKIDSAELNHIRYGLLSIDTWKEQISNIVLDEIDKLNFTKENEAELKVTLEKQLYVLIDKVNAQVRKSNRGSATGWVKQAFIDIFVSIDDVKKGVPGYADAMVKEMRRPRTQLPVKKLLKEKITFYINQTFDKQDMSQVNRILYKTSALDINDAREKLKKEIEVQHVLVSRYSMALAIASVLIFLLPLFDRDPMPPFIYCSLVVTLLILLAAGVTTPMIDLEAKISQMTFMLLDHPINFENQVLFFQSKSVLDVFWIMITHESLQMKFVGILMVTFSVIFPVIKLFSAMIYYYDFKKLRSNKIVQFFVLKSGKWSMADVLVVAIFMAYIGFNGIITSQIGKLKTTSEDLVILTTNGTSLQPGYYLFLAYAILAMFLSVYLTNKCPAQPSEASQGT